jgi:hypothetical protein
VPVSPPKFTRTAVLVVALFFSSFAIADGIVVSKIYDPYVQPLETEIEWRFVSQRDDVDPDVHKQSIGFGRSLSDRWAAEIYAIGVQGHGESFSVNVYELEAKWQLTEQGEYAFDWGLLFELERDIEQNAWEVSTQLLAARDFGRLTVTGNLGLIYEDGKRVQGEIESTLRLQARYRLKETFEPSLELHVGQDTTAVGPLISGLFRVGEGRKLRWELGVFAGVSEHSPDRIVKANLEYEF